MSTKAQAGPAYKKGDLVGYEITGKVGNVNKLKVDKKAAQNTQPTPEQAQSRSQPPPPNSAPVEGQHMAPDPSAIGMSLKLAGDILIHNARAVDGPWMPVDLATLPGNLW